MRVRVFGCGFVYCWHETGGWGEIHLSPVRDVLPFSFLFPPPPPPPPSAPSFLFKPATLLGRSISQPHSFYFPPPRKKDERRVSREEKRKGGEKEERAEKEKKRGGNVLLCLRFPVLPGAPECASVRDLALFSLHAFKGKFVTEPGFCTSVISFFFFFSTLLILFLHQTPPSP